MRFIIKILTIAVAVYIAAHLLPGVTVKDIPTTVIVALVLALLNTFIKPVLVILTIPITILTLGLFLLIINIIIVKLADYFVDGFHVKGWLTALIFSVVVSFFSFIISKIISDKK